ncbi:FAD-binding oxidoreductase [Caballeronia sp. AZ7_KS35]|uniref:FAD-binding oxidoreductase n=1 Tax=Caballeronia sp. AZ7_KS35 TaxID=2921762 RepID=UPI002027A5CA|nr:FAD-binding oxidoreductase [Caballeronia sp. AZ7_KS35]
MAESRPIEGLRAIVGDRGLVTGDDLAMRSCDPFRQVPPRARVLARPANVDELSKVMRYCHENGQRVVTQGGRTGVSGGAYAAEDEIIMSLERMTRIEEIDPVAQVAVVEAGITLEALQNAAADQGLFYPVDLGAKGSATIGGTIATNAGGNRVVRWGMTRSNVLGLEAVLADGTVVTAMNRLLKNNTGYDIKQFFIGTEGTLGVVTRAVLKLVAAPRTQFVAYASLPNFDAVLRLLQAARTLPTLSAFEVMWQDYYALMAESGSGRAPVAPDQPYYVLIECMGYHDAIDEQLFMTFIEQALTDGVIADAVCATSQRQIQELWRVREGAEVIVREMSPFVSFDISVDVRRAEAFIEAARARLRERYSVLRTAAFGHLGDNNLHLAVHVGANTVQEESNVERCVFEVVRDFEGALTAEHGIGQFKRAFLPEHVSPGAMHLMRTARGALDPRRLLNRDVLF